MKILFRILIASLILTLVTGCCACRSYQQKTRRPLIGTQWQLIQLNGKPIPAEPGKFSITLLEEDHRLTGIGACNRLSGFYEQGEDRAIKLGPLASTMMACPGMEREHEFNAAIESATHYDMDGPMLLLLSDGELRAVFQAVPEK